ncbi:MAG: dihydroorotase [Chloroflexi bacterium]|nr:dihydroorotase [Chloroflexota bacterium]
MIEPRFGLLTDAPATLLVAGVRVIDPAAGTDAVRDVGVVDGAFADASDLPPGAERVDGQGMVMAPGFVDLHAHLREPGDDAAETIDSGGRAAAHGGFTTLCAMPNTEPALDDADRVGWVAARAAGGSCRVRVIGAVTRGRGGDALVDLEELASAGVAGASDDGASVPAAFLRDAMTRMAELGLPLIEHAEDPSLAAGTVMRAGAVATRLGLAGWPPEAEETVVDRDIALAAETGGRLHVTHLSTRRAVEAVREAKAGGVKVTADVTPHHLALTDAWVAGSRRFAWEETNGHPVLPERAYDGACRVSPPLPSRDDARALLDGLRDGTIDAIATDHAPHPTERKLVPFAEAAPGLIGLETALSLGIAAVRAGRLDLPTLVAALSTRPASVIGEHRSLEVGATADFVIFDPDATWRVDAAALASRSANTPLLGMELPGVVRLTVAGGRLMYRS